MNTSWKMLVGLALAVVSSAGLTLAGPGGGRVGGGGGGGFGGGGGGFGAAGGGSRPAFSHTPSFSTPRQGFNVPRPSFNAPRFNETPAFRPSLPQNIGANRPAITPGNRPGIGQRPGIGNTPNWDNRLDTGRLPGINNRANIGNNININNRTTNIVRPTHNNWNHGDWHHGDWHGNWNHPWYHRPVGWWTAGYWAGAAASAIPWSWGYWPYYNPYYTSPVVVGGATIDYSQPIVMAQAPSLPPATPAGLTAEDQATPLFDAARNAFMQGDYQTALAQVDQAIALVPNDTVLHEFRGLVLFALGATRKRLPPSTPCCPPVPAGTGRRSAASIRAWMSTRSNSAPGAVREIAPGGSGGEIPVGLSLPDVRLHRCGRRSAQGSRATESQGPIVRSTAP